MPLRKHSPLVEGVDVVGSAPLPFANLSPQNLRGLFDEWGEGGIRAALVSRAVFRDGISNFEQIENIRAPLKHRLAEKFCFPKLHLLNHQVARDGTQKFVFRLHDHLLIETVSIPQVGRKEKTRALCVSTQAGCAMGCTFCFTGLNGLQRNLDVWEIIAQVQSVIEVTGERPTHIVFMGMGEPLHNFAALETALETLVSTDGFSFAHRKITVSTVGLLPQMQILAKRFNVQIALSLHAPNDQLREKIVPMTRKYGVAMLVDFMRQFPRNQQTRFMVEYVLLDGVNNQAHHAHALSALLKGIRCQVNLIPFNPAPNLHFNRPEEKAQSTQMFLNTLRQAGLYASVRKSRGSDILGACGQLSGSKS